MSANPPNVPLELLREMQAAHAAVDEAMGLQTKPLGVPVAVPHAVISAVISQRDFMQRQFVEAEETLAKARINVLDAEDKVGTVGHEVAVLNKFLLDHMPKPDYPPGVYIAGDLHIGCGLANHSEAKP